MLKSGDVIGLILSYNVM
jgi:hypothetical protein